MDTKQPNFNGSRQAAVVNSNGEWFALEPYSTMYMDYGLSISKWDGEQWAEVWNNPHSLSGESYGTTYPEEYGSTYSEDDGDKGEPWDDAEWIDVLSAEAGDLIDCFVG